MRRYPTTALIVSDGTGPRPLRSVAWRWEENVDVIVPVVVTGQDGTAVDLSDVDSCSLAFWASELDASPFFAVDLVQTPPEDEDSPVNLGTFTIPAASLKAGDYAVGAKIVIAGSTDTVLTLGRVQVFRRAA